MEYWAGPDCEVDFSRIQQWITDDQVDIEPFLREPQADPDPAGGRPACVP